MPYIDHFSYVHFTYQTNSYLTVFMTKPFCQKRMKRTKIIDQLKTWICLISSPPEQNFFLFFLLDNTLIILNFDGHNARNGTVIFKNQQNMTFWGHVIKIFCFSLFTLIKNTDFLFFFFHSLCPHLTTNYIRHSPDILGSVRHKIFAT